MLSFHFIQPSRVFFARLECAIFFCAKVVQPILAATSLVQRQILQILMGHTAASRVLRIILVYRFIYIFYTLLKRLLFCSILIVAISIEICILVIIAITMITSMQTFPIIIMQICAKKIIKSNRKTDQIDPCNCQTFVHGNYQCWSGGKTKY